MDFRKLFASVGPPADPVTPVSPCSNGSRNGDGSSSGGGSGSSSDRGFGDVAAALRPMLEASPHLVESLQRVGTIAQMVVLRPVPPPKDSGSPAAADGAGGHLSPHRLVGQWRSCLFCQP